MVSECLNTFNFIYGINWGIGKSAKKQQICKSSSSVSHLSLIRVWQLLACWGTLPKAESHAAFKGVSKESVAFKNLNPHKSIFLDVRTHLDQRKFYLFYSSDGAGEGKFWFWLTNLIDADATSVSVATPAALTGGGVILSTAALWYPVTLCITLYTCFRPNVMWLYCSLSADVFSGNFGGCVFFSDDDDLLNAFIALRCIFSFLNTQLPAPPSAKSLRDITLCTNFKIV